MSEYVLAAKLKLKQNSIRDVSNQGLGLTYLETDTDTDTDSIYPIINQNGDISMSGNITANEINYSSLYPPVQNIPSNILSLLQSATSRISFKRNGDIYTGSGFYYYETTEDLQNGYFVTAAHCVMDIISGARVLTSEAYIHHPETQQWMPVNTDKIYIDGVADVAIIETGVDLSDVSKNVLKLNTETVNAGDVCYVVGNPAGIDEDSISRGCVRDPNYCEPSGYQISNCILVNAPGIGGNSGGPIVNINGDIIGIYTFGRINTECFGGGSNQKVLKNSLSILKNKKAIANQDKLYLGMEWNVPTPFTLKSYYNNTSFDTKGVVIDRVNTESPFYDTLQSNDLLLMFHTTDISQNDASTDIYVAKEFGNSYEHLTPGILLYYPKNIDITIHYIESGNPGTVRDTTITLDTTYDEVSITLDAPLQSGYSQETNDSQITNKLIPNT